MRKSYIKKLLVVLVCSFATTFLLNAQNTTITTAAAGNTGYDGADYIGGDVTITFVVKNSSSHDIVLTGLEDFKATTGPGFPLNPGKFILWYSTTSLSGDPGQVTNPIWTKLTGDTVTTVNLVPGYNTIFSTLDFTIPANTTYRFALESFTGLAYSGGLTPGYASPSIMTKDSVSLILGDANIGGQAVGYAGSFPNSSYTNSWFTGSITFHSSVPCTSPPNAGAAISNTTDTCSGFPFKLDLTGQSNGFGQTYQWQSSLNNTTWTNMAGATESSTTTSQAVSTYYRCAVTCSGNTDYSVSYQVTTPLGVAGTYTINSAVSTGGTNFQTFADAINYIACGINGPVVFNVVPNSGPYNEQVKIPFIGGSSSINTVTFNGHGEALHCDTISAGNKNKAILTLNDADHIVIDSLVIDGSAAANYCWGILFTNKADSNIVRNCTVNNNVSSTALAFFNGILFNGSSQATATSGNNGNYNLIENNTITGGAYGIYLFGAGANNENVGNKIVNNKIKDFYAAGIYSYYIPDGLVVSKNDISRPTRTNTSSTFSGINIAQSTFNALVEKNKIHDLLIAIPADLATCYAIKIEANTTVGKETKVFNNLIYGMSGSGSLYGIYNSSANNMQAYHNTIAFDEQGSIAGGAYGLVQSGGATGVSFINNIVSISRNSTGKHRCINYSNLGTIVSNHNALYINCPQSTDTAIGQFGTTAYPTLATWRTANSNAYDQQSVSTNPLFVNTAVNDYTPTAPAINDIGQNVNIATDIAGTNRTITPDPGAYEFSIASCTNPPIAGTAIATITNTCPDIAFGLELSDNSYGAGQTFQWQSSPNNSTWTNVGTAAVTNLFSSTQPSSNYYRCAVQCNGGTVVYSTSVKITTPSYLSGTFTINNSTPTGGSNFESFNDAFNAIKCGINGPVTFNVVAGSGPYNEHFTIPQIAGSSATNTLTINGNGATLLYTTSDANNRGAIVLNGADHVIIDSLTIDVSGGSFGWGVLLTNRADSNVIRKCTILASTTAGNQGSLGIFINGSSVSLATSGNNGNYNSIINNTIIGGYYSVYLYGNSSSSTQNINNVVKRNVMRDMYSYAVYATAQSAGLVIAENEISRPTRTTTTSAGGAYINTGCAGALVEKNKVHNLFDAIPTSTQSSDGFFIGANPPIGQENIVRNNLIYNMNGNGNIHGITCTFGNNSKMYHNTIVLDDQTATTGITYGIYQPVQATGIDFRNNLVYISRSGTGAKSCLWYGSSLSSITSNNNILYAASGNIASLQATNYATLAAWQAVSSNAYDQQSVSIDPVFTNAATFNYKPTAAAADNIGAALGVVDDIANVIRSDGQPDAGAYEFGTILPTSALSFKGERVGTTNKLIWTTATENNNLGFELLRSNSATGNEFNKVIFVTSKAFNGNSNNQLVYTYNDENNTATNTYYKLKQVDKNGKFSFSNTILLKNEKPTSISIVSIYPNPAKDILNISIAAPTNSKAAIIVADIFGKIVMQQNIILSIGESTRTIDVSKLATGNYTIKLSCENGCETTIKKFVKQ